MVAWCRNLFKDSAYLISASMQHWNKRASVTGLILIKLVSFYLDLINSRYKKSSITSDHVRYSFSRVQGECLVLSEAL